MKKYKELPKEGFNECILCGEKTKGHAFCKECWEEYEDKDLIKILNDIITNKIIWKKCPDCGEIYDTLFGCDCKTNKNNDLTCLICGEPSNGKHFCFDCWNQYKDRSIDIRLKHLKFDSILDDYGNLKYKCEDGRHVRSIQEQTIANMLWSMEIQYVYEETVNYFTEEDKMKSIHPDFYLPKYKLYIEHIGFTNKKHDKITEYKRKIYEEQGKKVIFTTPENLTDFKQFIKKELNIL